MAEAVLNSPRSWVPPITSESQQVVLRACWRSEPPFSCATIRVPTTLR